MYPQVGAELSTSPSNEACQLYVPLSHVRLEYIRYKMLNSLQSALQLQKYNVATYPQKPKR